MRYVHPDHDVVINAQGGYAVLERLGFKPATQTGGDEVAKKKKEKKAPAVKSVKSETEGLSRNQLMEEVKSRGIKNFRVMNKAELAEIAAGAKPERIEAIQKEAVERWKAGWSKK